MYKTKTHYKGRFSVLDIKLAKTSSKRLEQYDTTNIINYASHNIEIFLLNF
ncbi:hypothetical protein rpr22_0584 [Rickettsia prowazekii str. Rp22]|uniref:Uncharacterized protein n=1 Tax=Rickettsia prowazekii (strain Rp22) TaxID=449216 RepID=D5AXF3_RICPP|nr:hypothetical protein rpr22_0584 [Rickettsia prowazekii str. Rp22]EOB10913.1 UPF0192 protein [Rickettsia prowazekii str. Cairo 3]